MGMKHLKGGDGMTELGITQEYLLLAVNDRGRFSPLNPQQPVCFVAAALGQLAGAGAVAFTGEKIPCPPLYALVGRSPEDEGENAGSYLETLLGREEKRLRGLSASASPNPSEIAEAETLTAGLREILAARKQKGE